MVQSTRKQKGFQKQQKISFSGPEPTEDSDMALESKEIACFLYARKHLRVHHL